MGQTDYSAQINQSLAQANHPQSNLSQQFSGLLGGAAPSILSQLMHTQNLGNSFINSNGAVNQQNPNAGIGQNPNAPLGNPNPLNPGQTPGLNPYQTPGLSPNPINSNQQNPAWSAATTPNAQQFFANNPGVAAGGFGGVDPYGGGTDPLGIDGVQPTGNPIPITDYPNPDPTGQLNIQTPNNNNHLSDGSQIEQDAWNNALGYGVGQGQQSGINIPGFASANPFLAAMNQQGPNQNALNTLLQNNQAPNTQFGQQNYSNFSPQIQQLLQSIGGQSNQVNSQSINPSGFNQQIVDPTQIQNPGFQATQANLSGVPTGTQFGQGSQDSYNSIAQILQNQSRSDLANQHERFTGQNAALGSGASLADAQLRAQQIPQLQQALQNARQSEVSNQLQSSGLQQQGLLANAGMQNEYGLAGAQQNIGVQGQNISNLLSAAGINNQFGLGGAQLNSQNNQFNSSQNLQAQTQNQNAGLQNQSQNNNLLAQLLSQQGSNNANQGNLGLGQQGLNSQNILAALGLNQQGALGALNAQNQNQNTVNNANLGQNNILAQLAQGNSQGQNSYNLGIAGLNQQASQAQINNQLQALLSIFGTGAGLAGAGIPGGSANVNLGANQGSNGINLSGIASILGAFG